MNEFLPLDRRLLIISETIRSIERFFVHWKDSVINEDDLSSITYLYFNKAVETKSHYEFTLLMWELVGRLRNAHSWYIDKSMPQPPNGYLNFTLEPISGEWVVKNSLDTNLNNGDLIVSLKGKSLDDWYKEIGNYIGVKKEISRKIKVEQMLSYFIQEPNVDLEYLDCNGTLRYKKIHWLDPKSHQEIAKKKNLIQTNGYWIKESKVAYISIPSFSNISYEKEAIKLVHQFKKAHSIIIDLRGNGGGNTPLELIDLLMDRPYKSWLERSRHPEWMYKRHGNEDFNFQENFRYTSCGPFEHSPSNIENSYCGKIILLVDKYTGSAAEDFAMPFKYNNRGTIVGEHTYGSTGQPAYINLGENIHLGIGSIRAFFPNGDEFEGIGIEPDFKISLSRQDIYNGRDPVFEKALELV